ncbi:terminase small subunit [uncultured Fretibacterium sp.]|uniref:terminase small subunit n=1 Tax=uncultured Fretibacterium sp. TaxID=1678694 RepID=UPI00260BA73E|nr:terminase small subunit [uncultured Fretibacterium sp.]
MAKVGRPRKIKSVRQFEERAEAYFGECETKREPALLTGLILALGLSSRSALDEYAQRPEFADSVKKAKLRIEMEYEKALHGRSPTGPIFALKNFGWTDKQDVELSGGVKVKTLADLIMDAENWEKEKKSVEA